ncbi:MAG: site-2 protease family protein, partial [Clostridia bacterium]|nr:site-2 protease family protein [Clostridia bacterium]
VALINLLMIGSLISVNIGIMNLLPLPALDGGRILFVLIEAIRRKPIPPEKEGIVHFIGLILLFGLMIFATWNDIMRLISG